MKTRISTLIVLLLVVLLNPCCKKEDIDYTYEILDIQWVDDGQDFDEDGYVTSRKIKFNVNLAENVQRNIRVKVYYKLSETHEYIFYDAVKLDGVVGGTDTPVTINLGLDPELARGMYSFLFEIYEQDSDRKEASYEIENVLFERLVTDQNYSLNAWWSYPLDYDFDGIPTSANLNLDINNSTNHNKEIKVEVLYKNELTDDDYTSYFKSDYFIIKGSELDSLVVPTGIFPDTLNTGTYDFKIIVKEKQVFSPVLIYDKALLPALGQIPFESNWDDVYHYSLNIENTKWVDSTDNDGDGYAQVRVLRIDMDIEKDETVNVKLKVLRRPVDRAADDWDYELLDSSYYFPITGKSSSDAILFPIGNMIGDSSLMMNHGEWDIMLAIFEVVPSDTISFRYALDSIDNTFFRNLKFELGSEDL